MSSDVAIRIAGLGKSYEIRHRESVHSTLAETLISRLKNPFRLQERETFRALSDVTFDVAPGEVVGVVGRNGAGKSTLLKILSRITMPSAGRVEVRGRVGSLLEIGTGFHPELTGRENIYLNGSLLNMGRREIDAKFDEIVEFAGVEKFLDTQVKRFSSGMYVRLAFAVAAHLDSDILLVDEVLAVGDAQFQEKCLGRMRDASQDGRTVIFVSHQLQTVLSLCEKAVMLDQGRMVALGSTHEVVAHYLKALETPNLVESSNRQGTGELRVESLTLDQPMYRPDESKNVTIRIAQQHQMAGQYSVGVSISDALGNELINCDSRFLSQWFDPGDRTLRLTIRGPWLKPGRYRVGVALIRFGPLIDFWSSAALFDVVPPLPYPAGISEDWLDYGLVFADYEFSEIGAAYQRDPNE